MSERVSVTGPHPPNSTSRWLIHRGDTLTASNNASEVAAALGLAVIVTEETLATALETVSAEMDVPMPPLVLAAAIFAAIREQDE